MFFRVSIVIAKKSDVSSKIILICGQQNNAIVWVSILPIAHCLTDINLYETGCWSVRTPNIFRPKL